MMGIPTATPHPAPGGRWAWIRVNPSGVGDTKKGWEGRVGSLTPKGTGNSTDEEGKRPSWGWEPRKGVLPALGGYIQMNKWISTKFLFFFSFYHGEFQAQTKVEWCNQSSRTKPRGPLLVSIILSHFLPLLNYTKPNPRGGIMSSTRYFCICCFEDFFLLEKDCRHFPCPYLVFSSSIIFIGCTEFYHLDQSSFIEPILHC